MIFYSCLSLIQSGISCPAEYDHTAVEPGPGGHHLRQDRERPGAHGERGAASHIVHCQRTAKPSADLPTTSADHFGHNRSQCGPQSKQSAHSTPGLDGRRPPEQAGHTTTTTAIGEPTVTHIHGCSQSTVLCHHSVTDVAQHCEEEV